VPNSSLITLWLVVLEISFDILSLGRIADVFFPLDLSCMVRVGVSDLRSIIFLFHFEGLEMETILFIGVLKSYFLGVLKGD